MSTYTRRISVDFGATRTGHAAQITYSVTASGGAVLIAATGVGVTESSRVPGSYFADVTWDRAWGLALSEWVDTTDGRGAVGQEYPLPALDSTGGVAVASVASDAVDQIAAGVAAPDADAIAGATVAAMDDAGFAKADDVKTTIVED